MAVVESVALYGAELWWRGQKDRLDGIQLIINRQARAITGMLKTTPIGPLIREARVPAEALLEAGRQAFRREISMSNPGSRHREIECGPELIARSYREPS